MSQAPRLIGEHSDFCSFSTYFCTNIVLLPALMSVEASLFAHSRLLTQYRTPLHQFKGLSHTGPKPSIILARRFPYATLQYF
jgi:hypothetical protein